MAALQLCIADLPNLKQNSSSRKQRKASNNSHTNMQDLFINRRSATISLSASFIAGKVSSNQNAASALDLRFTAPDQTVEAAEAAVKGHAQDLLQIKSLLESESWREAQFALRESSAYLKQDLYTIIQAQPGSHRPLLRKLYSTLFNNVSRVGWKLSMILRSYQKLMFLFYAYAARLCSQRQRCQWSERMLQKYCNNSCRNFCKDITRFSANILIKKKATKMEVWLLHIETRLSPFKLQTWLQGERGSDREAMQMPTSD